MNSETINKVLNEIENIIDIKKDDMLSEGWGESGRKAIEKFPTEEIIKEIKETLLENEF